MSPYLTLQVGLVAIGSALVNIAVPKLIGRMTNIISSLISSNSRAAFEMSSGQLLYQGAKALKAPAVGLFFLFGLQGLLTFIYISAVSILGEKVAVDLRLSLYDSLISQDMQFFDSPSHKTTNLLECLSQDVSEFKHSFKLMFTQGLKHFVQLTGSAVGLLLINPSLTAILVSSLSVGSALGSLYGGYLRKLSRDAKEKEAEAVFYASEALGNMKTVRAFGNESQEKQRFFKQVEQVSDANLTLGKNIGIFQGFLNFGIGMMILGVLYVGGDLVTRDRMSGGDLMSYLLGIQSAQKSFSSISIIFAQSVKAWSSLGRIICYLKLQPSIPLINGETLPTIGGDIAFRNVDFAYPSRPNRNVFQNFCLEIPSGKMVALCGESGSGKSTAAALIERFYDPQSGSVLLDGKDIKTLDPTWLRKNIGFINQEPVLFACSILENIRYAKPEATKDEVLRVAQDANAHEFIEKFPDGYDTIVGERGTTLSGGQKQRIAIARALLKNPKILILDEATSALDATSEKVVQEALDRVLMNRTVLVIAHRLSTIENAHKIVVLGPEGVIEQGTHIDLIQKNGAYARLYNKAHMD